jgi:hypothetical protein
MPSCAARVCALAFLALLASCAAVRQIRPLDLGEISLSGSLGGPFTNVGVTIPLPLLSVGGNVGLGQGLDVEAGVGLISALYGIMHVDAGVNWRPWLSRRIRPGLMVSPKLWLLTDFSPGSVRIYPDLGLTAFWKVGQFWYLYGGAQNWFEIHSARYDGQPQEYHWLPTVHAGASLGRKKWQFQLEGKLYVPNALNTNRPAANLGLGSHGAFGVFVGVSRFIVRRPP